MDVSFLRIAGSRAVLLALLSPRTELPLDTKLIFQEASSMRSWFETRHRKMLRNSDDPDSEWNVSQESCSDLIKELSAQTLIYVEEVQLVHSIRTVIYNIDRRKLLRIYTAKFGRATFDKPERGSQTKRRRIASALEILTKEIAPESSLLTEEESVEQLLSTPTFKEKENEKESSTIASILAFPTFKERQVYDRFKTKGGTRVKEYCLFGTRINCDRERRGKEVCNNLHFKIQLYPHTDPTAGDCPFLDMCRHPMTCKYVHYTLDEDDLRKTEMLAGSEAESERLPAEYVKCDVRSFDFSLLGKFEIVMLDPPWDIHMTLPYGTMKDDEMRMLKVNLLQDDGYIFLWVTTRAMELGRECLTIWGYELIQELIWVKTNQLQRLVRTGRTGHWLNHSKEHCLVGVKGNPKKFNRHIDCDVVVSEVRETSRKPDEMYGLLQRLCPSGRKCEIFGRDHNIQPGWLTLGNQLKGVQLNDAEMQKRIEEFLSQQTRTNSSM